jgi:hypothetical protein
MKLAHMAEYRKKIEGMVNNGFVKILDHSLPIVAWQGKLR